jgi:hypothetical protein
MFRSLSFAAIQPEHIPEHRLGPTDGADPKTIEPATTYGVLGADPGPARIEGRSVASLHWPIVLQNIELRKQKLGSTITLD